MSDSYLLGEKFAVTLLTGLKMATPEVLSTIQKSTLEMSAIQMSTLQMSALQMSTLQMSTMGCPHRSNFMLSKVKSY